VNLLEGVVRGDLQMLRNECARLHEQVRFDPAGETMPVLKRLKAQVEGAK